MRLTLKRRHYTELVQNRKACRACTGLLNSSAPDVHALDSDEIGPWTRLHGDLEAEIMVVGQDWGDVRYFLTNGGLDDLRNPTIRTLERLLHSIGMDVSLSAYGQPPSKLFLTNAILCLKEGGLQAQVNSRWFENCGATFLKRQVEIVQPRVVVTLGERAYRAMCAAFELPPSPFRAAVDDSSGLLLSNGSRLIPVYHCGMRILNTHRPFEVQLRDWKRVKDAYRPG